MFEKINIKMMVLISSLLLFLAIAFGSIVGSARAAENVPTAPTVEGMELGLYYKNYSSGRYTAIYIDPARAYHYDDIKYEESGSRYFLVLRSSDGKSAPMWVYYYDPSGQGQWVHSSSASDYILSIYLKDSTDIVYSFDDIVDKNGDVFFSPAGMAELILKVVKSSIPIKVGDLLKTMGTLALCGVGCLALLVGLNLLPKVLWRFLA